MEAITKNNFKDLVQAKMRQENINSEKLALAIGCNIGTLSRLFSGTTIPTDEMLKQNSIYIAIGYNHYKRLSTSKKQKIAEAIGGIGAGGIGFASISTIISGLGIAGLSAVGITSGLGTLGALVGGGMTAGIGILAAVPLAVGAGGYGIVKGVKSICAHQKANESSFDPRWEEYSSSK